MYSGLRFYHGLIIFAVVLLCMFLIASPAQYFLGVYGLAITEFMFIIIAFISAKVLKTDFRNVFSFKLPPVRHFFAGLFLYAGMYLVVLLVLITTEYFYPSINETGEAIITMGNSASPVVSVFIMAVMPAFCEEMLHRGLILSTFKHLKSNVVIVVCCGLIFGLFHLDPYRFLSTALIGGVFAYITLKTNSLILPALFHFITNAVSVYAMFSIQGTDSSREILSFANLMLSGLWFILGSIAFPVIYIGVCIINDIKPPKPAAVIVISVFILIAGILLFGAGIADSEYIKYFSTNYLK